MATIPPGVATLTNALVKMLDAARLCLEKRFDTPSLILLYSLIDTLAWLDITGGDGDVHRPDFERWVNKYLLPYDGLNCTANDLYGARCGLLHSHSPESRMSRNNVAKQIWYSFGNADKIFFDTFVQTQNPASTISIRIETLIAAINEAILNFGEDALATTEGYNRVMKRAEKFFGTVYTPPT
ncbi:MAG: hypothetical protein LLG01_17000 [Planctomycetaceae bacterium]|nr:hypothetical protein [Planctomycetaceae bacterium]